MLMHTIERTFNHLWQVKPRPFLTRIKLYAFAMLVWPSCWAAVAAAIFVCGHYVARFHRRSGVGAPGIVQGDIVDRPRPVFFLPLLRRAKCPGIAGAALRWAGCLPPWPSRPCRRYSSFIWPVRRSWKSVYGAFAAFPVFLVWLHL